MKKNRRKGQITLDFTMISVFMLILFASLFVGLQGQMYNLRDRESLQKMSQVANIVTTEVLLASQVGPGYNRDFYVPTTFQGGSYSIYIDDGLDLVLQYQGLEYITFLDAQVQGNVDKGTNTISVREVLGSPIITIS